MKKEIWLFVFIIALSADIGFILSDQNSLRLFSKPLIVVSLLIYFISKTVATPSRLRSLIITALLFSLLGDLLLLFEANDPVFFITGLIAFLLAHIFYIIAFNHLRTTEKIRLKILFFIPVLCYYLFLIVVLYNYLNEMKIPVMVYGGAISLMLVMAVHLAGIKYASLGRIVFFGALLFIISDTILAFNKFYRQWDQASIMIMLSYGLAQLFISYGMSGIIETEKGGKNIFTHPQTT